MHNFNPLCDKKYLKKILPQQNPASIGTKKLQKQFIYSEFHIQNNYRVVYVDHSPANMLW